MAMSTHDRNSDGEETSAWPGTQPPFAGPVPPAVPQTGGAPNPFQQQPPQNGPGGWVPPTPPGTPPGAPFGGYGQPQMPTPPNKSGSKKGVLAAVAGVVVLAVAGAGVYFWTPISSKLLGQSSTTTAANSTAQTTTTATSAPTSTPSAATPAPSTPPSPAPSATPAPAALVDPADVQTYLANPADLSKRFDGADMQPQGLTKQPIADIDVSPYKCGGTAVPGMSNAYSGSGFTGFVDQVVNDSAGAHKFIQVLATFPTAQAASDFVSTQYLQWKDCSNTKLTITIGSNSDHATTGAASTADKVNTIVLTPATGSRQCERAMTASSNVVVDVRACAVNVGTAASTIARDISQHVAAPR